MLGDDTLSGGSLDDDQNPSLPSDEVGPPPRSPSIFDPPREWIAASIGEDFVAVAVVEDRGVAQILEAADQAPPAFLAKEDFAGSLPLVEDAQTVFAIEAEIRSTIGANIEDFFGSIPTDENPTLPPLTDVVGQITFTFGEDFEGAFSLDVVGVQPFLFGDDSSWRSFAADEEFGLPHPNDDASIVVLPEASRDWISVAIGEEFAGSLPQDEPFAWQFLLEGQRDWVSAFSGEDFAGVPTVGDDANLALSIDVDRDRTIVSVCEDFAGSVPQDDPSSWLNYESPVAIAVSLVDEEFGLPHPVEDSILLVPIEFGREWITASPSEDSIGKTPPEDAVLAIVFADDPARFGAASDEEFGLPHPIEDAISTIFTETVRDWIAITINEDFSGSITVEESTPVVSIESDRERFAASVGEDFAGSVPQEENSFWQTPYEISFSVSFLFVDEFIGKTPPEDGLPAVVFADDSARSLTVSDEEFGLPHPNEDVSIQVLPETIRDWVVVAIGEDFSGSVTIDDASIVLLIETDRDRVLFTSGEDFTGSVPQEEAGENRLTVEAVDVVISLVSGEDFGLPHPSEDPFSPVFQEACFDWFTFATSEDFEGSTPTEEATSVALAFYDQTQVTIIVDEEFGLPHPIEDSASIISVETSHDWITVTISEEFAGSVVAEEGVTAQNCFERFDSIIVAIHEDFVTSLSQDEHSTWQLSPEILTIVAVTIFDEEFGLPHPNEDGTSTTLPEVTIDWITASIDEDLAGGLPQDEFSTWLVQYDANDLTVATIFDEMFAGIFTIDEFSDVPVPPHHVIEASPYSIARHEDFAGLFVFEDSQAQTAAQADPDWITVSVGEKFAQTFVIDDTSISPPILQAADASVTPIEEVFVTVFTLVVDDSQTPYLPDPKLDWITPPQNEDIASTFIARGLDEHSVPSILFDVPILPPFVVIDEPFIRPRPAPPKPKPTPSIQPKLEPQSGGNAVFLTPTQLAWLPEWVLPTLEEKRDDEEEIADLAIMHVAPPEGAAVKALASGTVEKHVDSKGRESVVLNADDGARHWYADVGSIDVEDGARVKAGDTVAHTKPNAQPLPDMIATREGSKLVLAGPDGKPKLLGEGLPLPKKPPAQIVFIEPSPPKRYARLVPIQKPPQSSVLSAPPPLSTSSIVLRVLVPIGAIAAILWAASLFEPRKPKQRRTKRKKKR